MTDEPVRSIVRRVGDLDADFNLFTKEALAAQDGKTVPLTLEIGGPVVGEATLKYVPANETLVAEFQVDDPKLAETLKKHPPHIFEQER